jgi:hypothetical protein
VKAASLLQEGREVMPYKDPERKRQWEQASNNEPPDAGHSAMSRRRVPPKLLPTESPSSESKDKGSRRPWAILLLAGAAILAAVFLGFMGFRIGRA